MAKLTTAEILARARKQDAGGAKPADDAAAKPQAAEPAPPAAESPAKAASPSPKKSAEPGPRPSSTSDILAKARAQAAAAGGAEPKPKPEKKPAAPKPAAGGSPKSTKDILAAARAQAAGDAASTAVAEKPAKAPAVAKPAAKTPAKTAAAGGRPSVQEMLKQARGTAAVPKSAAVAPPLPARLQRPAPSRVRPDQGARRGFLKTVGALVATPFAAGWVAFTAASVAATLGMARFMMPNVLVEPPSKFKIGPPDDYPAGTVSTKWKSEYAIWITHQVYHGKSEIYALSTVCTHLGCTPNWLEGEQKFKCPCHGSGFYPDGINFEGPAPRPLERYGISLASDGMLEVDKSVKFQEELGQWTDAASFVAAG
jgi:cytochrome b6-f complex iron-sulfur subunit